LRIRKSGLFILRYEQRPALDIAAMLRGSLAVTRGDGLASVSLLTGETYFLSDDEMRVLGAVPSDQWVSRQSTARQLALQEKVFDALLAQGLLIGDGEEEGMARLREQEQRHLGLAWDEYAALYHLTSRMRDVNVGERVQQPPAPAEDLSTTSAHHLGRYAELTRSMSQSLAEVGQHFGPPPHHFHRIESALERRELPIPSGNGRLFELLMNRKTVRIFDEANPMTAQELSTVLYFTYGSQGYAHLLPGLVGLRKTSPSGGSLHPIEAYPLVLNVEGVEPGLYHYNVESHSLELMRPMDRAEAQARAECFALGQSYFRTAHVMFILTARWYRNFWKYRNAQKSYKVIHMDAGHLSQTLYLVCTELGLGAFFTGALNDVNIEQELGIDPLEEGVLGISGCGRPWHAGPSLSLETLPYVPGQTRIG
jgi:SagB-type dehydrogenase family enzyme